MKILKFVWWMIDIRQWEWYQIRWLAYFILGLVLLNWVKWGILLAIGLAALDFLVDIIRERWNKFLRDIP